MFKLRRRTTDLLVTDGLTQSEFVHSTATASELLGPRVKLTFRWISQHTKSCPLVGLISGALPSDAQDVAGPHSCGVGLRKWECPWPVQWSSWHYWEHAFCGNMRSSYMREYVAVITIVGPFRIIVDGSHRDVPVYWAWVFFTSQPKAREKTRKFRKIYGVILLLIALVTDGEPTILHEVNTTPLASYDWYSLFSTGPRNESSFSAGQRRSR